LITVRLFYLCPTCFAVSASEAEHHGRPMLRCEAGEPGDEQRKPKMDASGRLQTHAPRWFLEAAGRVQTYPHLTPASAP